MAQQNTSFGKRRVPAQAAVPLQRSTSAAPRVHVASRPEAVAHYEIKWGLRDGWIIPLFVQLPLAAACFYVMYGALADPAFFEADIDLGRKGELFLIVWRKIGELPWMVTEGLFLALAALFAYAAIDRMFSAAQGEAVFKVTDRGIEGIRYWRRMRHDWDDVGKVDIIVITTSGVKTHQMHYTGGGMLGWRLVVPTSNKDEIAKIAAITFALAPHLRPTLAPA